MELETPDREPTAWQRVTAGITDDGTVPAEVALQAFALTIGPIPGVEVPEGDPWRLAMTASRPMAKAPRPIDRR